MNIYVGIDINSKREELRITIYGIYTYKIMKDLKYKIKCIRMNNKTWEKLKKERKKSKLSWNLFLLELLKK